MSVPRWINFILRHDPVWVWRHRISTPTSRPSLLIHSNWLPEGRKPNFCRHRGSCEETGPEMQNKVQSQQHSRCNTFHIIQCTPQRLRRVLASTVHPLPWKIVLAKAFGNKSVSLSPTSTLSQRKGRAPQHMTT